MATMTSRRTVRIQLRTGERGQLRSLPARKSRQRPRAWPQGPAAYAEVLDVEDRGSAIAH
jgi:hypothetical protein